MRIPLFILSLLILCPATMAQDGVPQSLVEAPDSGVVDKIPDAGIFRHFIWGASPEDVKKFETASFYKEEGGSLYFVEQPGGGTDFRRLIRYDFRNGKLWRGNYEYQELSESTTDAVVDRYKLLKSMLASDYGAAPFEQTIWKDKFYRKYPKFWARAILSGDLKLRASWTLPDTRVALNLSAESPYYFLSYTAEQVSANAPDKNGILGGGAVSGAKSP